MKTGKMLAIETLQTIVERIVAKEKPQRIILFGSRARRDARAESDYDILVIKESSLPRHARSVDLYELVIDLPVEVEFVVYTPGEVREWEAVPHAFISTVLRTGEVLYERQA